MRFQDIGFTANGTINTARFVKLISGTKFRVAQAGDNEAVYGVSTQQARRPEITGTLAATTEAAIAGEPIDIEQPGTLAWVTVGAAVVEGAYVKSDTNGKAVTIAAAGATKQHVAGIVVIGAANADELALIMLLPHRQTMD